MKKLVLFLLFAAFVLSAKEAVADCVCYGTNWNNGFEYATIYCIEAADPCYHLDNEELKALSEEIEIYRLSNRLQIDVIPSKVVIKDIK